MNAPMQVAERIAESEERRRVQDLRMPATQYDAEKKWAVKAARGRHGSGFTGALCMRMTNAPPSLHVPPS